jgi:hypothetical protein
MPRSPSPIATWSASSLVANSRIKFLAGLAILAFCRFVPQIVDTVLCPFRRLTALPCPLCGITRAMCALLKGEWLAAIAFHPLSPLVLGAVVAMMFGWKTPRWSFRAAGALFLAFGIVRIAILTL